MNGLHIAAVELQLVRDTGVPQAMEYDLRQIVVLDQLVEGSVDDLILNRLAVGRTEYQIEVVLV